MGGGGIIPAANSFIQHNRETSGDYISFGTLYGVLNFDVQVSHRRLLFFHYPNQILMANFTAVSYELCSSTFMSGLAKYLQHQSKNCVCTG